MAAATGRYVKYLDDDDLFVPSMVDVQVETMDSNPHIDICYSDSYLLDSKGTRPHHVGEWKGDPIYALLNRQGGGNFRYLFRNEVAKASNWSESVLSLQELDYVFQLALNNYKFKYAPGVVAYYRHEYSSIAHVKTVERLISMQQFYEKVENQLVNRELLTVEIRKALAVSYFRIGESLFKFRKRQAFRICLNKVFELNPEFHTNRPRFGLLAKYFGYEFAEWVSYIQVKIKNLWRNEPYDHAKHL